MDLFDDQVVTAFCATTTHMIQPFGQQAGKRKQKQQRRIPPVQVSRGIQQPEKDCHSRTNNHPDEGCQNHPLKEEGERPANVFQGLQQKHGNGPEKQNRGDRERHEPVETIDWHSSHQQTPQLLIPHG
jgi:hypothetical protein